MSEPEIESPVLEKQPKPKQKKNVKKKEEEESQFQQQKSKQASMKEEEENDSDVGKKKKGAKKPAKKPAPAGKTKPSKEAPKKKGAVPAPPVKAGKQPLIKEDCESLLQYMKEMNRPFTLNYLKDTLHLKAALLGKNLEQLQKNGDIVLKEVGASKVFLINQSHFAQVPVAEMDDLGRQLDEKTDLLKQANQEVNKLTDQLKQITRVMRLSDLEDEVMRHQLLIHEIDDKMTHYQSDTFVKANESEVVHIETQYSRMAEVALKRRRIYERAIDTLLEGSEMTVKEFEAIIGVSRD